MDHSTALPARVGSASFDELVSSMLTALKLEREAQARGSARRIELRDGERVEEVDGRWLYQFPHDGSVKLKDDTPVTTAFRGEDIAGTVISSDPKSVRVAFGADLGSFLPMIELSASPTFLIESLEKRLREAHAEHRLDTRLTALLLGYAEPQIGHAEVLIDREGLDDDQWRAVVLAQSSDIVFLWGPPGTGKTLTLAAAVESLYRAGKRILVVSNTNKAVDSFLKPLCERLERSGDRALEDGFVLRVGAIVSDALAARYKDLIQIDGIVLRKSGPLAAERRELMSEREKLRPMIAELRQLSELSLRIEKQAEELRAVEKRLPRSSWAGSLFDAAEFQPAPARGKRASAQSSLEKDTQRAAQLRESLQALRESLPPTETRSSEQGKTELARLLTEDEKAAARLGEIEKKLRELRTDVQRECRVCAATASMIHLRPEIFGTYDVVVVDEASMLHLPAVLYAATLSRSSAIVAGDFRQLPPVVQLDARDPEKRAARSLLEKDVFFHSGVADAVQHGRSPTALIQLTTQYRMDDAICALIRDRFYGGRLKTGRAPGNKRYPALLSSPVSIIDTSDLAPYVTRPPDGSRVNFTHARLIHALVTALAREGWLRTPEQLGVITPYRPQQELLTAALAGIEPLAPECGTVHLFQGNERDVILFDLVESIGLPVAGFFRCTNIADDGARLLNVALSRARDRLVVIANMNELRRQLPLDSVYRELLFAHGLPVVAAQSVFESIRERTPVAELVSPQDIEPSFLRDMAQAQRHVLIVSADAAWILSNRNLRALEAAVSRGCKVRIILRAPDRGNEPSADDARRAISELRAIGAVVDLRDTIGDRWIVADDVVWSGGANGPMIRSVHAQLVAPLALSQLFRRRVPKGRGGEDYRAALVEALFEAENPPCPTCGGETALDPMTSPGGSFRCLSGCTWRGRAADVRETPRGRAADQTGSLSSAASSRDGQPAGETCSCGRQMKIRAGARGDFWGCTGFPDCRRTKPVIPRSLGDSR